MRMDHQTYDLGADLRHIRLAHKFANYVAPSGRGIFTPVRRRKYVLLRDAGFDVSIGGYSMPGGPVLRQATAVVVAEAILHERGRVAA